MKNWWGYHPLQPVKWPPFCNTHSNGMQHSVYDYFTWPHCQEKACCTPSYGCGGWRGSLGSGSTYFASPTGHGGLFYKPAD
jgi:hypothetical protein